MGLARASHVDATPASSWSDGLPSCLMLSLFGRLADGGTRAHQEAARRAAFVPSCVGCRYGAQLAAVDAFVEEHATNAPPRHLYRLAADFYETRVRSTLGGGAPPWSPEAIQAHYEACRFSVRMTLIAECRVLRGVREMLLASLHRAAARGVDATQTHALYIRLSTLESALHARLWSLPPPTPRSLPAPLAPLQSGGERLASFEDGPSDDDASAADTTRAVSTYDAASARQALRDTLFEVIEPCTPPSTSAQPTLHELRAGADAADVMARDRLEQQRGFQEARPAMGRRCFCRGRRGGEAACHVQLDGAFLEQLLGERGGLRLFFREPSALRAEILSILRLRAGPIKTRRGYGAHAVFGFRRRKARARA